MKLTLVNPPSCFKDATDLAPPLGLLLLATLVESKTAWNVSILDFNLDVVSGVAPSESADFYGWAIDRIETTKPDVLGFTSMCLESHVALELADLAKKLLPGVITVFGGSHFGSLGEKLIAAFPAVDYVITGEGELSLPALLHSLETKDHDVGLPAGVTCRRNCQVSGGERNQEKVSLDTLPFPRYDFIDLDSYFKVNPRRLLLYEGGRGCVFKCAFCYSPAQHGPNVRDKCPSLIVRELRLLAELGAKHVFFVQDNFVNSPDWASSVCALIATADLPITWSCYATLPQLSEEIIKQLNRAKCTAVFLGIDAVTPTAQARLGKRFARNWDKTLKTLAACVDSAIVPTCAFILEPGSVSTDFDATIKAALDCRELGCDIHLNTLTVYSNTAIEVRSQGQISEPFCSSLKPELLLDAPPVVVENRFAERCPSMFPYHEGTGEPFEWERLVAGSFCLFAGIYAFPESLRNWIQRGRGASDVIASIDVAFIAALRRAEPESRRVRALQWLSSQLSTHLPESDQHVLAREIAALILSLRVPQKSVFKVVVGGEERRGTISDFINVRGREVGDFLGWRSEFTFHEVAYEFALRVDDTIRFLRANRAFGSLVEELAAAARGSKSLVIDTKVSRYLERSGWIRFPEA